MLVLLLLLLVIPSATPISFNFSSFNPNMREIQYEGSAYVSDQLIQLTPNQFDKGLPYFTVGRAKYWQPVHLWDKSTRKLTDFTTNFNFTMLSQNRTFGADGLAFFLAPEGSKLPPNSSGRSLGLFDKKFEFNSTENYSIVAVEFDTFRNNFDPSHDHIGVDINSIVSVTNVSWPGPGSMKDGRLAQARISYNSTSTNLSVSLTYPNDPASSGIKASLSYVVDLRDYLPEQVTVGFSAATGQSSELHTIYSWEFSSSLETGKKNKAVGLVVGLVVGGGALIAAGILIMVISFVLCRKRGGDEDDDVGAIDLAIDEEFEKGAGPKRFSYKELVRATNNFNEEGKLGQGGFGAVYRGFLKDLNLDVAVKRVSRGSKQGIKEYISEVKIISRLRHKNLVQLVGWCHQRKELLLVYEFMPNGSLDSHLFRESSLLTWEVRYNAAIGLASAILYLHELWEQCVVHRDVKSSNVMLDSSLNAKLGDFGLARLIDHGQGPRTTALAGTMGYMAPECISTGKASKESDVYSFGIVALEIACGRRSVESKAEENKIILVEWVWELYGKGKLLEAADSRLFTTSFNDKQVECLMVVGLWCAHPDYNFRPSIRQAIQALNFEMPLPVLPLKMPVPTYHAPPNSSPDGDNHHSKLILFSIAASPNTSILYPR